MNSLARLFWITTVFTLGSIFFGMAAATQPYLIALSVLCAIPALIGITTLMLACFCMFRSTAPRPVISQREQTKAKQTAKEEMDLALELEKKGCSAETINDLQCPVTLDFFDDPVILSSGHSVQRSAADLIIKNDEPRCPCTQEYIQKSYTPNLTLKNLYNEIKQTPTLQPQNFKYLRDPITKEYMTDPVILSSGHSVQRSTANAIFKHAKPVCPISKKTLHQGYVSNFSLKKLIVSLIAKLFIKVMLPPIPVELSAASIRAARDMWLMKLKQQTREQVEPLIEKPTAALKM